MSSKSLRAIHNARKKKLEDLRQKVRDEEFNIKLMFQEYKLLLPTLIPFLDKRYEMMTEIKKEEAILEPPDTVPIRVDTPIELYQKLKCYTTDRGISMTELIRKWMTEYTLYCESEYKRIFSAKLEHRDGEKAAHIRECRRANAKKQWETKREEKNKAKRDEGVPFSELEDGDSTFCYNCEQPLTGEIFRDEKNRVFCSDVCQSFMEGVDV